MNVTGRTSLLKRGLFNANSLVLPPEEFIVQIVQKRIVGKTFLDIV